MNGATQAQQTTEALIELSKDYKRLIITCRVPNSSIQYTNEYDPDKLKESKLKTFQNLKEIFANRKS